jgi:hypothetical protein
VIDFDALWASDKLAACAPWAQAEYAWLYGLADACGCFEITNLRVIWGRVAAIRGDFTIERLQQVFSEFREKGLLFVWEHDGKSYAHWTGSDVPGRLPAPSWRMRLERFAPPVPRQQLAEYMARFARGRAAMAGGGFHAAAVGETAPGPEPERLRFPDSRGTRAVDAGSGADFRRATAAHAADYSEAGEHRCANEMQDFKAGVEEAQAQDLDLNWNRNLNKDLDGNLEAGTAIGRAGSEFAGRESAEYKSKLFSLNSNSNSETNESSQPRFDFNGHSETKPKTLLSETAAANPSLNLRAELTGHADEARAVEPEESSGARRENRNAQPEASRNQAPSVYEARRIAAAIAWREKELATQRELWVGRGPVCTPRPVRPEQLEKERLRMAARSAGKGS